MAFEIGSTPAQFDFVKRHSRFFDGSDAFEDAISAAFDSEFTTRDTAEAMIFVIGLRCAEDFREIAVLAGNGHGWGATAHLRGMYERAVVGAFIRRNPAASLDFVDYDFVRRKRTSEAIKRTFNIDAEDQQKIAQLNIDFERVRGRFEAMHKWHKLDFVAMAGTLGKLGTLIVPCYYMPLAQAHATFASATYRLGIVNGSFVPDENLAKAEADRSFQFAHLLMLNVLTEQHEAFKSERLGEFLGKAYEHYKRAWLPQDLAT